MIDRLDAPSESLAVSSSASGGFPKLPMRSRSAMALTIAALISITCLAPIARGAPNTTHHVAALIIAQQDEQAQDEQAQQEPPPMWESMASVAPITHDDLNLFVDLLGLSRPQRLYFQQVYEQYVRDYAPAMGNVEQPKWEGGTEPSVRNSLAFSKLREKYREKLERVQRRQDRKLFDGIAVMLSDEQLPAIERVRKLRQRHVYTREWEHHLTRTGFGYLDLTELAHASRILDRVRDILVPYESAMTELTRKVHGEGLQLERKQSEAYLAFGLADDYSQWGELNRERFDVQYADVRPRMIKVDELNFATNRQIQQALADDQEAARLWRFYFLKHRYGPDGVGSVTNMAGVIERWWRASEGAAALSDEAREEIANPCLETIEQQIRLGIEQADTFEGRSAQRTEEFIQTVMDGREKRFFAIRDAIAECEQRLKIEFPPDQLDAWRKAYTNDNLPWGKRESRSIAMDRAVARRQVALNTLIDLCVRFGVDRPAMLEMLDEFAGANRVSRVDEEKAAELTKLWDKAWRRISELPELAEEPALSHVSLLERSVRQDLGIHSFIDGAIGRGDVILMAYAIDPELEFAEGWFGPISQLRDSLGPLTDEMAHIVDHGDDPVSRDTLSRRIARLNWQTYKAIAAQLPEDKQLELENMYLTQVMWFMLDEPYRATMLIKQAREHASVTSDQRLEIAILAQSYEDERLAMTRRMMELISENFWWTTLDGKPYPISGPPEDAQAFVRIREQRDLLGQQARRSLERLLTELQWQEITGEDGDG